MTGLKDGPLTIAQVKQLFDLDVCSLVNVIGLLEERLERTAHLNIWIEPPTHEQLMRRAAELESRRRTGEVMPLFGVPFVVKDNIDVEGLPTTAGCPAFAYRPERSAHGVELLLKAGALLVGKTNLDQFATGLVGTRSPYGACLNAFKNNYISGGSSSGSAVAVAAGLASFALGTDTAGSGRVPAAFNNIVGLKPTRGRLSTRGVVPACASLDCVSVFALTASDAQTVMRVMEAPDPEDPYQRTHSSGRVATDASRIGVPAPECLEFFGNAERRALFENAMAQMKRLGKQIVPIDFSVFRDTAAMLYEGPWVAERQLVAQDLLANNPDALLPVIREIFESGGPFSAADTFRALHKLQAMQHRAAHIFKQIDLLMVPTAGSIYRVDEVAADPIRLNTQLGYYTNFANLLDLAAVAVPAGFDAAGLPFGVSLMAPAWSDEMLLAEAESFHRAANTIVGAGEWRLEACVGAEVKVISEDAVQVAVVGAHLRGQPLNHELVKLGAKFIRQTQTAAEYRLYALAGTRPAKPGLVRVAEGGVAIELEVWEMSAEAFGKFVAAIPPPLGIGTVRLADGSLVKCFLCEAVAVEGAEDISAFGGWRGFVEARVVSRL